MRKLFGSLLAMGLLTSCASMSHAAGVTFAQFLQQNSATQGFTLTATNPSNGALSITGGTLPVNFIFGSLYGSPLAGKIVTANLTLSAVAQSAAQQNGGSSLQDTQPFQQITFTFKPDVAQVILGPGGPINLTTSSNLLTGKSGFTPGIFSPFNDGGDLSGADHGNSASLVGTDNADPFATNDVVFTSDFLTFDVNGQDGYGFSFSSVNPFVGIGGPALPGSQFLTPFTASGTGTFSTSQVPEPGVLALLTAGGISMSVFGLRRRRRA